MSVNFSRRNILKMGIASFVMGAVTVKLYTDDDVARLKNNQVKFSQLEDDSAVKDNLDNMKSFNSRFPKDIFLIPEKRIIFQTTLTRIERVKNLIGYANFNLVSFDDMLLYAHRYPNIGRFTKVELKFIDEIFFYDANKYGFYGDKIIKELTSKINKKETIKIAGSGHYLFKGAAVNKLNKIRKDVGPELVLTSGVRGVVKQLQLFFSKLDASNGNLSLASRSLAPPGHSYHGIGDFDVGKKNFGIFNFTSKFALTSEYKRLIELNYINLRYTKGNDFGVRYEPWHIKVV